MHYMFIYYCLYWILKLCCIFNNWIGSEIEGDCIRGGKFV